jgi:hypothetical protein
MRFATAVPVGAMLLVVAGLPLLASELIPIERQLLAGFPSVRIGSPATFDDEREPVGNGMVEGLRAHFPIRNVQAVPGTPVVPSSSPATGEPELRLTYPRYYGEALVAAFAGQRVVLRAAGARGSLAETSSGMLVYRQPYPSVDVVQLPGNGRSEELLLLHNQDAPLVYDFEVVEMSGVSGLALDDGAIRFLAAGVAPTVSQIGGVHFTPIPRLLRIERPWVIDATGRRSESHASWSLLDKGNAKILRLTVNGAGLSYPLLVDPTFSITGSLSTPRSYHSATLLQNGKIFVAGGQNASGVLFTYEVFDPATGTVTATGNMYDVRESHTATLLRSGKVLLAGGWNGSGSTNVCEIYDPSNNTIGITGLMGTARRFHAATLLPSGKVLLAGGTGNALGSASILASAELFDPAGAGTFGPTASMGAQRASLTATLLSSGKVLIAGGGNYNGLVGSAELYDPAGAGTFGPTGSLAVPRSEHTATLLTDGRVLIAGGCCASGNAYQTSCELYNPTSGGTFGSTGSLNTGRKGHTATLLPNGKVLIAGGTDSTLATYPSLAELYDPAVSGGTFSAAGNLNSARNYTAAVLLPNAQVLMVGGYNGTHLSSLELFDWATGTFASTGSLLAARQYPSATLLTNGNVLVAGGYNGGGSGYLNSAEIYSATTGFNSTGTLNGARALHTSTLLNSGQILITGGSPPAAGGSAELADAAGSAFTVTAGALNVARNQHSATLLSSGKVLIVGGNGTGGARATAELFDPSTGLFTFTGSLGGARFGHTAILLATGKVLIAGGYNGSAVNTAELYDPGSGTFSSTGSMAGARYLHSATLLPSGKVLIAGGATASALATAELYDPYSGTFSPTGSLITARFDFTATLLPNAKVLVAGGQGPSLALSSAELYDPRTGLFSAAGSIGTTRGYHAAALLLNGKVLLAGGYNGAALSSAVTYDTNPGYLTTRAPLVTSATVTLVQPAALTFGGSRFGGDSEASGGGLNSSATNYPLLQLQRVDNDQMFFVRPAASWSDTTFTSISVSTLANGYYRGTVITNGIPSDERVIIVTNGFVPSVPLHFLATATSTSAVALTWTATANATGYDIYRSSLNSPFAFLTTASTNSAIDSGLTANTTYLYKIRAVDAAGSSAFTPIDLATTIIFTDPNVYLLPVKAVHFTQLRTAVNAVRAAGGLAPFAFTDPTLTAGVKVLRLHLTELRDKLDEARFAIGVPAISYFDPTITAGSTTIKAIHIDDLRGGTQ